MFPSFNDIWPVLFRTFFSLVGWCLGSMVQYFHIIPDLPTWLLPFQCLPCFWYFFPLSSIDLLNYNSITGWQKQLSPGGPNSSPTSHISCSNLNIKYNLHGEDFSILPWLSDVSLGSKTNLLSEPSPLSVLKSFWIPDNLDPVNYDNQFSLFPIMWFKHYVIPWPICWLCHVESLPFIYN